MLMHQINAENAANSSGPSALPEPGGPRGVGRLPDSCLHIWDTRVRGRAFADERCWWVLVRRPLLVGARTEPPASTHTRSEVSVSVCSVWNPDLGFF